MEQKEYQIRRRDKEDKPEEKQSSQEFRKTYMDSMVGTYIFRCVSPKIMEDSQKERDNAVKRVIIGTLNASNPRVIA